MPLYATPIDLAVYVTGDPAATVEQAPPNAAALIRQASSLVTDATRGAVYAVTPTGVPADATVLEAMTEATCAQAAAWSANGVDPVKGRSGAAPAVTSKSLGGASVAYSTYAADAAARSDLASGDVLVGAAWRALDQAGLLTTKAQAPGGGSGVYPQEWPFDPLTGRSVGKYDDPQFGSIGFANE